MRTSGVIFMACTAVGISTPALSQDSSISTADEYVCALTDECGDDAPAAAADGEGRTSRTRGITFARPDSEAQPVSRTPVRRATTTTTARRPVFRPRVATGQRGRVNLRLAFGPSSSTLTPNAQAEVRAFAEAMRRPQIATMRFRIEGHTDSAGGRTVNRALSQRRAQAVADYLTEQGIARSRLEVEGFGFDRPLPGTPASSGRNRRVEAVRIN